ncbi:unnamed protein product [Wuchereria bancrofti]|uniref:Uncharacterized protein n=1 Tax=Wuchereria bancrofti TaxID=6293 RepID=A0A3P7E841_WUCBA|nr:unnamed protein product [Wuchereria bancrofti]
MEFERDSLNAMSSVLETIQQRIAEIDIKNRKLEEEISELEQQRILNVPNNQGTNEYMQQNNEEINENMQQNNEEINENFLIQQYQWDSHWNRLTRRFLRRMRRLNDEMMAILDSVVATNASDA